MTEVRVACENDAETLIALKKSVLTESPFLLLEAEEYQPDLASELEFIRRYQQADNSVFLLALENGQAIGHIAAQGGIYHRNHHCATVFMAVLKTRWGQGIGKLLMQHLLHWFEQSPLSRLELTTAVSNLRAYDLYLSTGFMVEGVKRQDIQVHGLPVDSYLMSYLKQSEKTT